MIETIAVRHNPVTLWERYSLDLTFGTGRRQFSEIEVEHRAEGGFWQCSFTMHDTWLDLWDFFARGLDREVVVSGSDADTVFEGFIQEMTLETAGRIWTIGLDPVSNEVWVRYKDSASAFQRTDPAEDAASQDRFGQRDLPISGGQLTASSTAEKIAEQVVNRKAWPKPAPLQLTLGGGVGADSNPTIQVTCMGWIHKLRTRVYNQTASTGVQAADLELTDLVAAVGTYIKDTAFKPNSVGVTKVYDADRSAFDIMMDIARLGDTLDPPMRWVLYMDAGRLLLYEPAAPPLDMVG